MDQEGTRAERWQVSSRALRSTLTSRQANAAEHVPQDVGEWGVAARRYLSCIGGASQVEFGADADIGALPRMGDIGSLLCGGVAAEGIAKSALNQLSQSINAFSRRAIKFLTDDASEDALAFGPFCARVLLENSSAALVGRLDTFRMMYLSEFQTQPEYEHGKRAKSAFSWIGDVIPEEKSGLGLWSVDHDPESFARYHSFSSYDDVILRKLSAHGPVLIRGGRGSGKSALLIEAYRRMRNRGNIFPVYMRLRYLPLLQSDGNEDIGH